jgi:peptidyl-dipeptidase A
MPNPNRFAILVATAAAWGGCGKSGTGPEATTPAAESSAVPAQAGAAGPGRETPAPTPDDARAFVDQVDADLRRLWPAQSAAEWAKSTNITEATEAAEARAAAESMKYLTEAIKASRRFDPIVDKLDADTARKLKLLRIAGTPAPEDPQKAAELAEVKARMEGIYGKGKVCQEGGKCLDLRALEDILAENRDPRQLTWAWRGWHEEVGRAIKPLYQRFALLVNDGARAAGFSDAGEMWRSGYDMPPEEFASETQRLWQEVQPLYNELHCYVRRRLTEKYGKQLVSPTGPMPAHLLGNMWAQSWSNIYPLVEPYKGQTGPDVSATLKKQKYTPEKMVKLAENFFTSLGLKPLPATFWERSMFVKPADREVVCHASAWDLTYAGDVRIKMCIQPTQEDLITIHHELGHDYYYLYYHQLPLLYQGGAHDGFHEAVGDTIALSITPDYLKQVGLLKKVQKNEKALLNQQMFLALDKISFLPWGLLVDQWRWDVFGGKVPPDKYNERWWELRKTFQGVVPPVERTAADFDPGAKYHIPANTPYMRYFLAFVLQFQFHKSLCKAAGHEGPLHECSIYGSKEAGERLAAMLSLGASKPWPDALEVIAGTRRMSAEPLIEYFLPLMTWLKDQNKDKTCGW